MLFLVKDLVICILSRVRYIRVSIFGKIRVLTPARILYFEITVASERGINTIPHIEHHTFVFHVFFFFFVAGNACRHFSKKVNCPNPSLTTCPSAVHACTRVERVVRYDLRSYLLIHYSVIFNSSWSLDRNRKVLKTNNILLSHSASI